MPFKSTNISYTSTEGVKRIKCFAMPARQLDDHLAHTPIVSLFSDFNTTRLQKNIKLPWNKQKWPLLHLGSQDMMTFKTLMQYYN